MFLGFLNKKTPVLNNENCSPNSKTTVLNKNTTALNVEGSKNDVREDKKIV